MCAHSKATGYVDRSLMGWAEQLRLLGIESFRDAIDTDVERDFHLIAGLNLPRYGGKVLTATDFIQATDELEADLVYDKYFLILIPMTKGLDKHSLLEFTDLEVAREFVIEKAKGEYQNYYVRISEFETNLYGGSVMCNDGILITEMAIGLQKYVSYGMTNVVSARLTSRQASVEYSTTNSDERRLLWRVIQTLRREGDNLRDDIMVNRSLTQLRGRYFLKGYFEFAYTLSAIYPTPRLVFWDVKLQEPYYNIQDV